MQKFILELKNLDKMIYKIMEYGLLFSALLTLVAVVLLLFYIFLGINFLYYLGLAILKSSFIFAVEFVVCGIVVDFIRKRQI